MLELGQSIEMVSSPVFSLPLAYAIEFENLIFMLESELTEQREYYYESMRHLISLMVILLQRNGCFSSPLDSKWSDFLKLVTEQVDTITLNQAADYLHLTKPYFCKLFKKKFGVTFLAYLNGLRIQKAKLLLTDTALSVESIYREVGFTQSKYFYSYFKKVVGTTPLKYKKIYAKIDNKESRKK